jgi:hypothetical protein
VADQREVWERMDLIPQEIVDAGDVLVVLSRFHLRARESGIEFDTRVGSVFWLERGLIAREREFADWDEALGAAGIAKATEGSGRGRQVTSPAS